MEIDNWQTMILIFEVVCRIFKNKEENMERFIRKLFGLTFSALLAVVMLFSSVTVFAEEYDSKYPSENVNIAKTRAEMFLNSVGKPALLEEGILLKNLNGEYEAVSFSMPENGYIIVNIKDLT